MQLKTGIEVSKEREGEDLLQNHQNTIWETHYTDREQNCKCISLIKSA